MIQSNVPHISVCIPTFNAAAYLRQAIESVLLQKYQNFEMVIIDNYSTDETVKLIEELIKKSNGRIRFYKNDRNIGLVGNLNRCLEYARGTYIKFLMADDILLPSCLEQMAAGLDTYQSVVLVTSSRLIIDEHGRELTTCCYSNKNVVVSGKQVITECLFKGNHIGEPTAVMFRRSDIKRGFSEDFKQLTDLEMWFYILEHGDMLNIPEPLSVIRWHAGQLTNANVKSSILVEDNVKLFELFRYKSYIKSAFILVLQHKLLMSLRLWRSRKYLPEKRRKFITRHYSSHFAYYGLAPMMSLTLYLVRTIKRKFGSLLNNELSLK